MLSVHIKGLRKKVFSRLAPEIAKTVSELIRAPGEPVLVSRDAAVFYEDGAPRRNMVLVELRWRTRPQEMLELAERLRVLLQDAPGCSEVAVSFGQWQPEELYTFHAEESYVIDGGPRCTGIRRVHFDIEGTPRFDMTPEQDLNPALADVETTVLVSKRN